MGEPQQPTKLGVKFWVAQFAIKTILPLTLAYGWFIDLLLKGDKEHNYTVSEVLNTDRLASAF